MNHKERVLAVLEGRKADRIPTAFSAHFPQEEKTDEASVKAHLQYFKDTENDICKVMNENQLRGVEKVETPDDLFRAAVSNESKKGIDSQVKLVSRIAEELEGEAHIIVTVHGPVVSAHHMSGRDGFFVNNLDFYRECIKKNPKAFKSILEVATEKLCDLTRRCIDEGADGIYFAALGTHNNLFTDDEYEEIVRPFDLQVLQAAKNASGFNILHICDTNLAVRRFADYPVDVVNWEFGGQNPSMQEGFEIFKESYTIMGGLDSHSGPLINGTETEIKENVFDVINAASGRKFILGAGCTLPTGLDTSHMRAAVSACEEYDSQNRV